MIDFGTLSATGRPLLLPGAHDALSARLIELAGFPAYGIGGAALAAMQLALPDAGLQSFGEYRDAVARIMEGASLPVMVDGENGFGDVKAVTRTVRSFERLGASALALEDLVLPPRLDRPPTISSQGEINAKLAAAVSARRSDDFLIIGRTDAAYAVSVEEALGRCAGYQALGVDGIIAPGLPSLDAYKRLRDAVTVPILAVVVPGTPWFAPTVSEMAEVGIEVGIYPAAMMWRVVAAIRDGLDAIRNAEGAAPAGFDPRDLARYLDVPAWAAIDEQLG